MTTFAVGDEVICRVLYGEIVNRESSHYESEEVFEVAASNYEGGYLLLVPTNLYVRDAVRVTDGNCVWYDLTPHNVGDEIIHVFEKNIVKKREKPFGLRCSACGELAAYAENNKEDRFICFLCRTYPIRCYY